MVIQPVLHVTKRFMVLVEYWLQHHFLICLSLMLGLLVLNELQLFGIELSRWDPLLISGAITFLISIRLALHTSQKMEETLTRLINRGSLQLTEEKLKDFKGYLEARADNWAQRAGLITGVAILIAFLVAFGPRAYTEQLPLTLIEVILAYIAGHYLGRMASYGGLGWLLRKKNFTLKVQPGHLDGAAGLKPVGDLYFFQAMLIAIPALYLAIWWFLIPVVGRYSYWREPYLGLLAVVLIFELLAFLVPMWSFHQEMQDQKIKLLKEADELSEQVVAVQSELAKAKTDQERNVLKDQLSYMIERYWAIDQMPTWPVDSKVRRRFALNNLALFLPLISQFIQLTATGQNVIEQIQQILTNLSE